MMRQGRRVLLTLLVLGLSGLLLAQTLPPGAKPGSAEDSSKPIALPVLARPVPERAALEDPTRDASAAAAVAAPIPQRTRPLPFQRLSVPDPFENRGPVQLKEEPPEDSTLPPGR